MGQSSSSTTPGSPSKSASSGRRRSFRSPFSRRKKYKQPLSATFQAPNCNGFDALNINTATVEQFMTLPGINRRIAQSIVDHRSAIGGRFQRVDDLALVSGIGAEKLEQIRPEICIKRFSRSNNGSSLSSRTPSLDSIFSEPNSSYQLKTIINVNTSSVFQLQQINGMNQEIAANLVDYRNRKGPFKSLDDLIKVKGLSNVRLGAIRSGLCVNDNDIPKTPKFSHAASLGGTMCPTSTPIKNGYRTNNNNVGHRKSISMPIKINGALSNGFTNVPVNDIFDLLGAYSHRPTVEDSYNNTRNGHSSIRLASWNLHRMCSEKSANLGVKEVICRTILENRLSILCVQEIIEPLALHDICEELNNPRLRRVTEWKQNTRNWKYLINSTCADGQLNGLGFVYDADRCDLVRDECFDISLDQCAANEQCDIAPSAYVAAFRLSDWTCHVLNTYLRYFNLDKVDKVIKAVETRLQRDENDSMQVSDIFIVAGDFSGTTIESETAKYLRNNKTSADSIPKLSNLNLEELRFYSVCEPNATSFNETPAKVTPISRITISSCNILCREKMPSTRSAFREALYKTKTPLKIYDSLSNQAIVPSANDGDNRLCGYWGIVRQGLCHMAIPKGYTWGGSVSEHCPVWVELYKLRERFTPSRNTSIYGLEDDADDEVTVTDVEGKVNGVPAAATKRRIYQRRSSLHSNSSFPRMNGNVRNGIDGGGMTNGDMNASSDSVFLK